MFEKINKDKEELKLKIQKIFTNIRNNLNERENEVLLEVDNKFDNLYFKEELIKESEKLPNKIKIFLEKGKTINTDWNNENKLIELINDCINIENSIQNINMINKNLNESISKNNIFNFYPEEKDSIIGFLRTIIKLFQMIDYKTKKEDEELEEKKGEERSKKSKQLEGLSLEEEEKLKEISKSKRKILFLLILKIN